MTELRTRLPGGAVVTVGPAASPTGWVLQYALLPGPKFHAPMGENSHLTHQSGVRSVRKFQDLMLRPALEAVPGVAEVATLGGETNEVVVQTSADQLRAANVALSDVIAALRAKMATHAGTARRDHPRPAAVQGDAGERRPHDGRRRGRRRRVGAGRDRDGDREARRGSDGGHRARQAGDRGAPPSPAERGERSTCSTIVPSWRAGSSTPSSAP